MGRSGRKAESPKSQPRKTESAPKVKAESAANVPATPIDFSHLKPVPKNRGLLIVSALLLALWFVALITLVFVSRS